MTYKAYYYLKNNGRSPLEEYLETIKNKRVLAAIKALIDKLLEYECRLPSKFVKPVKRKIYELRLEKFKNQYRVFYFIYFKGKIILLDGSTKKSQKIPPKVFKKVQNYYQDYLINQNEKSYF